MPNANSHQLSEEDCWTVSNSCHSSQICLLRSRKSSHTLIGFWLLDFPTHRNRCRSKLVLLVPSSVGKQIKNNIFAVESFRRATVEEIFARPLGTKREKGIKYRIVVGSQHFEYHVYIRKLRNSQNDCSYQTPRHPPTIPTRTRQLRYIYFRYRPSFHQVNTSSCLTRRKPIRSQPIGVILQNV